MTTEKLSPTDLQRISLQYGQAQARRFMKNLWELTEEFSLDPDKFDDATVRGIAALHSAVLARKADLLYGELAAEKYAEIEYMPR